MGWGLWQLDPQEVAPVLQYAHVTVLTTQECADITRGSGLPMEQTICTGPITGGIGGCNGDSGGPMIQEIQDGEYTRYVQVGVAAWAVRPCGAPKAPTGYVAVTYFRDWFDEIIADGGDQ